LIFLSIPVGLIIILIELSAVLLCVLTVIFVIHSYNNLIYGRNTNKSNKQVIIYPIRTTDGKPIETSEDLKELKRMLAKD
jgi:hypothetical protein